MQTELPGCVPSKLSKPNDGYKKIGLTVPPVRNTSGLFSLILTIRVPNVIIVLNLKFNIYTYINIKIIELTFGTNKS